MQEFSTPMMKQYMEIKRKYPDCLLLFRMGDFYELFLEDALTGSRILNITLTKKSGGKDGKIPMAGVPYHAADTYIAKLVKSGYKVAICEQLSPPSNRGLVKRDVVRIVTPGTLLDENNLEKKENNYIICITSSGETLGLAVADLSTGYFALTEVENQEKFSFLRNELLRLKPSECLLPENLYSDTELLAVLHTQSGMNIFPSDKIPHDDTDADRILCKHFGVKTLAGFGVEAYRTALVATAALMQYLTVTQNGNLTHITKIVAADTTDGVQLDRSTMINLELFSTIRENDTNGSLLATIDLTITAMGGRLLKNWLKRPLRKKEHIEDRLDSVEALSMKTQLRDTLRDQLTQIPDVERLLSRLSVRLGNARDLQQIKSALQTILTVKQGVNEIDTSLATQLTSNISDTLLKIIHTIDSVFFEELPFSVKDGGMIRPEVSNRLDSLRASISGSKAWITELEKKERQRTGIGSLKVRFNKVFGYYIEVSRTNAHLVPQNYIRKQTLVNAERYITQELKNHEEIILTAEEKINEIEYEIFSETLEQVLMYTESMQKAAESIAIIDCLCAFSLLADRYRYTRPKLLYSGEIRIKEGRHPVVERLLTESQFVPNDITLDNTSQSLLIITGPNMAGKSVAIRQVAIIVLLAHIGSFVPATAAHIGIVDRIFVRSGASDVITSGLSTFMVEMVETAHILNNATGDSLIIMDEIGRGTSTYDGISIAWAVAEFLATHFTSPPKVLFATHYHELQELENEYPSRIKNFHMVVTEQHGEPIFLHTLLPGGASHSFGVAVAKLAGVPSPVVVKAKELLIMLEKRGHIEKIPDTLPNEKPSQNDNQPSRLSSTLSPDGQFFYHLIRKELNGTDIATMTPLEALNKLADLKEKLKLFQNEGEQQFNAD